MKIFTLIIFLTFYKSVNAESGKNAISIYAGRAMKGTFMDIVTANEKRFWPYYMMNASYIRELSRYYNSISYELEGNFGSHLEKISLFETNIIQVLRILVFPWDRVLDTSFAFGSGLSYTNGIAYAERDDSNITARLLHLMIIEITFTLGKAEKFEMLLRLHHRSGFLGLFSNVWGGSNYLCIGLKYRF